MMNDSQEMQITETQIATTDPFTRRLLRNPLVNSLCNHVYEKDTIFELLENNRRVKCPVVGCVNRSYITEAHLLEDINIQEQIRNQVSQMSDTPDETIEDSMQVLSQFE